MRLIKIFFIVFPLFASLFFPHDLQAGWKRLTSSPVLTNGISNSWDNQFVSSPSVLFNGTNYFMWYMGSNNTSRKIGIAESSDGIIWNKHNLYVIDGNINSDNYHLHNPRVIKTENDFKMWFSSSTQNYQKFHINYIESSDGINWKNQVLNIVSPFKQWHSGLGISFPNIILRDNKYYMWYAAEGVLNQFLRWRIGFATSIDLVNWEKYPDPVLDADQTWENSGAGWGLGNPMIILESDTLHMFYHADHDIGHATSSDGIRWTKDANNPVLRHSTDPNAFDSYRVMDPYVIKKDGKYFLYYTGENNRGTWQIGLATSDSLEEQPSITISPSPLPSQQPSATATPTATPTPTPTTIPSPTPTPRDVTHDPIIFVPGLGASWNPVAIFSCSLNSYGDWKMGPYVRLYERLIKTLTNKASLQLNKDVYVYTYDWRLPMDSQGEKLQQFVSHVLEGKPKGTKVRLVGHSLGGLVIRSFLTNFPNEKNTSIAITIGTPHEGTPLAYSLWENGEISHLDVQFRIPLIQLINHCRRVHFFSSSILKFHRTSIESNRATVQALAPSLETLLPVFDFLKKNNTIIPINALHYINTWLPNHIFSQNSDTKFYAIAGNQVPTLEYLSVEDPSDADKLAGNWVDGKPIAEEFSQDGDGTILQKSAMIPNAENEIIEGNHADIVTSDTGIKTILKFLNLTQVQPATSIQKSESDPESALTVAINFSSVFSIQNKNGIVKSQDNIATINNPKKESYRLTIQPNSTGKTILDIIWIQSSSSTPQFVEKEISLRRGIKKEMEISLQTGEIKIIDSN